VKYHFILFLCAILASCAPSNISHELVLGTCDSKDFRVVVQAVEGIDLPTPIYLNKPTKTGFNSMTINNFPDYSFPITLYYYKESFKGKGKRKVITQKIQEFELERGVSIEEVQRTFLLFHKGKIRLIGVGENSALTSHNTCKWLSKTGF